jgi:uncharacterized protein YcnI
MKSFQTLAALAVLLAAPVAGLQAHVSFVDNSAVAGKSFIATANISHGCTVIDEHYDSYKVEVELPAGVTARPMHSSIGSASVDDPVTPTLLTWEKSQADAQPHDTHFYQVQFRFSAPNAPLTTLAFRTTQYCTDGSNQVGTLVWEGVDAPTIRIVPAHSPGWNKYTAQADIDAATIQSYFGDALIVWSNDQAYSANPVTSSLIANPLTLITAGTEYWVKY